MHPKFHTEIVKNKKSNSYFRFITTKIPKECCLLERSFSDPTDDDPFNPNQIAPTTGMNAAVSTEELLEGPSCLSKPALST